MKKNQIIIYLFFSMVISGCNGCYVGKGREKPDVSGIQADVKLFRFDNDLFEYTGTDYKTFSYKMEQKYGDFFPFYINQFIIGPRPPGDTSDINEEALRQFLSDGYIRRIQHSINARVHNTESLEKDLTEAFKNFKYYFPEIIIPKVVAVNSGFSLGAFTYADTVVGVGLDMYLGADHPDYDSAGIYYYLRHKMTQEYISRNSMEVLYNSYFGEQEYSRSTPLVEAMVEKGKKMYFLSAVLPDAPDHLIVGFTPEQTAWCEKNEYDIWKFMNDKDLLYKSDYMNQKRYLDDGPTIPGMPAEAPGAIGNWMGLQIVRQFMKEAKGNVSLKDLVVKYNSKTVWDKARYRPSKPII